METNEITLQKVTASSGMVLTNADNSVFAKEIYLGKYDSADNYYEITEEEAEQLIKKQQEEGETPEVDFQPTTLELVKNMKLQDITAYDTSDAVNSFTLDGESVWLDKDTRVGLMNSTQIQKAAGQETTTLWFGGKSYTLPCDTAIQMLSALELYALACYNVTAQHKAAVEALQDVESIEAYDYTTDYPEKLVFTTK